MRSGARAVPPLLLGLRQVTSLSASVSSSEEGQRDNTSNLTGAWGG